MNKQPLISIVLPVYNREKLVLNSIESVLNQTYKNFELIVVDDYSNDNTHSVISSIPDKRIKLLKHDKNRGASAARNTGIKASRGDWIAFHDSDDLWNKNKLEKQVETILTVEADIAVIHCGLQYFDFDSGKKLNTRIIKGNINNLVKSNVGMIPGTPTMVIRKSSLDDVGYFDETIPANEESELGIRIAKKYKFKLVDEVLVLCARNHVQINSSNDLFIQGKQRILEKHLDFLSSKLIYNFSLIIAGNSIVKGNIIKAKKYIISSIKAKPYHIKSYIILLLLFIAPQRVKEFYSKRYIEKGLSI